jgi:hypothetical protein
MVASCKVASCKSMSCKVASCKVASCKVASCMGIHEYIHDGANSPTKKVSEIIPYDILDLN